MLPNLTLQDWVCRVATLKFEGRAFVNGQYIDQTESSFACVNPATGETLVMVQACGDAEVSQAVSAARKAFVGAAWANLPPRERGAILKRFARLIRDHQAELALLESLDMGKPVNDAMIVDVPGAAYCLEWYAEAIDKIGGEVAPVDPKLLGLVTREPIGVVAAIVPWNFPLLMAAWKFAPALAAGNAVILKPSEKSPLTAIRIAEFAHQAGVPAGIFQVLPGDGQTGQALALHHDVDCVAFTGSTAVGKKIAAYAAQSNLKRVWLELGGKSPNIVLEDCPDVEKAAKAAASAIYFNMGQMCTAGSRVLIDKKIKAEFLEAFKRAAEKYRPNNPLDPVCRMGAIVDGVQHEKILNYIQSAHQEGAQLVCGGQATTVNGRGWFIEPTAFICSQPNMTICQEEIFGPVLSIIEFSSIEEAITIANDTDYGLAAAIWTSDLSKAHLISRRLRAGTVWVNCYDEGGDMNLPFGGYKQSGNGRDKSLHALEKYTELKTTLIKL